MLLGRLVVDGPAGPRGSIKALLSPTLRRTTILLWFIWYAPIELHCCKQRSANRISFFLFISNFSHRMSCAFCYYGLVLMSTELFGAGPNINNINTGDGNACRPLATTDYMDLLWTTLAEFPGIFATIFIIEKCGRKKTMAFQFLLYAGCVTMLTATSK